MTTDPALRPHSELAIPPGELIEEELAERGMTPLDLALLMGRPSQAINEIIRGRAQITQDAALELETALGIPAHLWLSLELDYQTAKAQRQEHQPFNSREP
ncbi:MAG: HigA family addiction module antitoxin [Dehalococcoidia bacterium]